MLTSITNMSDPTITFLVKMPRSLKSALEAYATTHHLNLSQVVREALTTHLNLPPIQFAPRTLTTHPHNQRHARQLMHAIARNNPAALEALLSEIEES